MYSYSSTEILPFETDREMDVLEYHMRKYCDTDDLEATEFGKENAVDD